MNVAADHVDPDESVWPVLDHLARSLHLSTSTVQATLDAIAEQAIDAVPAAAYSGLILVDKGVLTPQATVGTPPRVLDELQKDLGEGPCLEAASNQSMVLIDDTDTDARWPQLMEVARSMGVASMLCVPLYAGDTRLGALSMYGKAAGGFTRQDERLVRLYATHAALALADARRVENLTVALHNRDLIGQAKGILMERSRLTADAAFQLLAAASQDCNLKLAMVAQYLVDTGNLPTPSVR